MQPLKPFIMHSSANRLFLAFVFSSAVLGWSAISPELALAVDKSPQITIIKPNAVQDGNAIKWEFKVKPNGAVINKVTLDILPLGGIPVFGEAAPLPSGRGFYFERVNPVLEDEVVLEEGKAKKLPPGRYWMVVIATFNGTKTIYDQRIVEVAGANQASLGKITDDMDFVPASGLFGNRMKMHGKYEAADMDHSVRKFDLTLLAPDGTAQVKEEATTPKFSHTFKLSVIGTFHGYVRSPVISAATGGNRVGHVYTIRHAKKATAP